MMRHPGVCLSLTHRNRQIAPLPIGTLAPDFMLPRTPSTRVALHGLRGQPVVLVFYPLDWEPLSRDQLVLCQKIADDFSRPGARLLGISVDSAYCHAACARGAAHLPAAGGCPAARRGCPAAMACIGTSRG